MLHTGVCFYSEIQQLQYENMPLQCLQYMFREHISRLKLSWINPHTCMGHINYLVTGSVGRMKKKLDNLVYIIEIVTMDSEHLSTSDCHTREQFSVD